MRVVCPPSLMNRDFTAVWLLGDVGLLVDSLVTVMIYELANVSFMAVCLLPGALHLICIAAGYWIG